MSKTNFGLKGSSAHFMAGGAVALSQSITYVIESTT